MIAAAVIAALAIVSMLLLQRQHAGHVSELLEAQGRERHAWAVERHELNTRIQAPELARVAPPAPPAEPGGAAPVDDDEDDVDESHLVGTVVA